MIPIYINNLPITVKNNTTILESCESINLEIPKFCFHKNLGIAGNCRMCLVEIENSLKPVASCAMPVTPLMKIHTDTPLVKKARESVLEFLLINHPLDCPICDQGGECDLQDQTISFGTVKGRFFELKRTVEDKNGGPFIKMIMTRCIHCTRCVRFANDICGIDHLGTTGRGNKMEISFYLNKVFQSEFSGNVADLCPVGALTLKNIAFKGRAWEINRLETIDILDSLCSSILVHSFNNKIIRILPKMDHDLNMEWITNKTRFFSDSLSYQIIKEPLLRIDNQYLPVKWEEALQILVKKQSLIDSSQQKAIIGNLIDLKSLHSFKTFLSFIGVNNIEYQQTHENMQSNSLIWNGLTIPLLEFQQVDLLLLIHCNVRQDIPLLNLHVRNIMNQNKLTVYSIGDKINLTYPVTHLGSNLSVLLNILKGKHSFCKKILNAKKFSILIGSKIYTIKNNYQLIQFLQKKFSINFLHDESGYSNFNEIFKSCKPNKIDPTVLFLYNTDIPNLSRKLFTFTIYIGHHFTENAQNADLILPCTTYLNKNSYFLNLEYKFKKTVSIFKQFNLQKSDSNLFKNLIFLLLKTTNLFSPSHFKKLNLSSQLYFELISKTIQKQRGQGDSHEFQPRSRILSYQLETQQFHNDETKVFHGNKQKLSIFEKYSKILMKIENQKLRNFL